MNVNSTDITLKITKTFSFGRTSVETVNVAIDLLEEYLTDTLYKKFPEIPHYKLDKFTQDVIQKNYGVRFKYDKESLHLDDHDFEIEVINS